MAKGEATRPEGQEGPQEDHQTCASPARDVWSGLGGSHFPHICPFGSPYVFECYLTSSEEILGTSSDVS